MSKPIPELPGLIGEHEFFKIVVVGSQGKLVPLRPEPDLEQIDFYLHPAGIVDLMLLIQAKNSWSLDEDGLLFIRVEIRLDRMFTHSRFWYFFAYFDAALLGFRDPVFLVPSPFLHRQRSQSRGAGVVGFVFKASLKEDSHDKWVPYRTTVRDIATRFDSIFAGLPTQTPAERLALEQLIGRRPAA